MAAPCETPPWRLGTGACRLVQIALSFRLRAALVVFGTPVAALTLPWQAPGDPALALALARFPAQVIKRVRPEAKFCPASLNWFGPICRGGFGQSSLPGRDVQPDRVAVMSYTLPLALLGSAIALAHIAMTLCFRYAEASRLVAFEYIALLRPVLAELLIFGLPISTNLPLVLGGAVIAAAERQSPKHVERREPPGTA